MPCEVPLTLPSKLDLVPHHRFHRNSEKRVQPISTFCPSFVPLFDTARSFGIDGAECGTARAGRWSGAAAIRARLFVLEEAVKVPSLLLAATTRLGCPLDLVWSLHILSQLVDRSIHPDLTSFFVVVS